MCEEDEIDDLEARRFGFKDAKDMYESLGVD